MWYILYVIQLNLSYLILKIKQKGHKTTIHILLTHGTRIIIPKFKRKDSHLILNSNNREKRRTLSMVTGLAGFACKGSSAYLNWKKRKAIETRHQAMQSHQNSLKNRLYVVNWEIIRNETNESDTLREITDTVMNLNNRTTAVEQNLLPELYIATWKLNIMTWVKLKKW